MSLGTEGLKFSEQVVAALPPAFIMLVIINAGFIGLVLWFLNSQMEQRMALVTKLVDHCLAGAP